MNSYITFIVKKVLLSIVTVFAISIFAFLIMQMTPGDPVRAMLGAEADEEIVEATRTELNLDKPLVVQYTLWLRNALRGDFGTSLVLNQDIGEILATRIPVTDDSSINYFTGSGNSDRCAVCGASRLCPGPDHDGFNDDDEWNSGVLDWYHDDVLFRSKTGMASVNGIYKPL